MSKKRALITGITGQDGSYLAEHLLGLGYEVHGLVRRVALEDQYNRLNRINHIIDDITLHPGSLESYASIFKVVAQNEFHECYHLAAQSFVAESFADGFSTMNINIAGCHHVLSALQELNPGCRFYFAGSSEMFGKVAEVPQSETTPFHPRSPYGISKVAGYYLTQNFREAHGMYCCSGILFNHESPRRGHEFVTRKIAAGAARIKSGMSDKLRLGNLEAKRDWGHAKEYVQAMHLMLQQPEPEDFVVATGETHTVREFCDIAFRALNLNYEDFVVTDPTFYRAAEVDHLIGNFEKARRKLGWEPKISFDSLVEELVSSEMQKLQVQNYRN